MKPVYSAAHVQSTCASQAAAQLPVRNELHGFRKVAPVELGRKIVRQRSSRIGVSPGGATGARSP